MASALPGAAQAVLRLLHEIGDGCPSPGEFARRGVRLLPRLVPAEITTLSVCDLPGNRRRVVSDPAHAFDRAALEAFDRHFRTHPLVAFHAAHGAVGVRRISDSLAPRAFRATALYADYYARVGLDHAVALPLHVDDRVLVSFVLNRRRRDFADRDCALLDAMRPALGMLYRQSRALEQAQRALALRDGPGALGEAAPLAALTPREREVLGWVMAGKSNAQIAAILGARPRTIAKHLQRIYEKLGVETRTAAAMRAVAARGAPR